MYSQACVDLQGRTGNICGHYLSQDLPGRTEIGQHVNLHSLFLLYTYSPTTYSRTIIKRLQKIKLPELKWGHFCKYVRQNVKKSLQIHTDSVVKIHLHISIVWHERYIVS